MWAEGETGREVAFGEVGELVVRGRTVMLGYRGAEAAASARIRESVPFRTFYTGDLVRRNEDGSYSFVGRADGQIKRRGYRIEPGEVEHALAELGYVVEACAFGDASADPGESRLICAVVVTGDVSDSRIYDDLRGFVPSYMLPDEIRIRDELPRTSTGKVDRVRLAGAHDADD
ncbi:hypothetical protein GCM10029992_25260 [Glycomyces albus]